MRKNNHSTTSTYPHTPHTPHTPDCTSCILKHFWIVQLFAVQTSHVHYKDLFQLFLLYDKLDHYGTQFSARKRTKYKALPRFELES